MLSGRLIEVFDILCHHRRSNGLPCFLDDQALATTVLDTHLLGEHIHDDEHDDGEQHRVILHLVYLEHDERLVEERLVHVVVQRVLQ